jgi:PAS domain S-box-containing protein
MNAKRYHRRTAAIALACATLVAATWAITLERVGFERERAVAQAHSDTANVAVAFEEHTLRSLKSINQTLVLLSHEYRQYGANMNLREVLGHAEVDTSVFTVAFFDRKGNYITGTGKGTPANVSTREYFTAHRERNQKLFIGKPARRTHSGEVVLLYSRRMERDDGRFEGVVALSVAPRYFTDFFQNVDLGPHGLLTLIGLDGVSRVRRIGQTVTAGEDMRKARIFAEHAKRPNGAFLSNGGLDGVTRFVHYRTLAQFPLVVSVAISERDTLASLDESRKSVYWVAAVITFFLLVTAAALLVALRRHHKALDALVRSEARFRAIFDQAFVGMTQHALDGRPLQVNQKICSILGYSPEEMLRVKASDVVHPGDLPEGGDFQGDDFRGDFRVADRRFIRKDGAVIWTNAAWALVRDAAGKPDCYVSVVQDITEFKRIDRMKSEFVSMVSHELRTPLTSIRGSLGLISGGVAGVLPDAARNLVDIAKKNCERLIRLINDILDSEKIESGKMYFELKEAELGALLEAAVAANEGFAAQHKVRLELQSPGKPVRVNVDSDRLNQVIANLISNAVKFSPPEAAVEVKVLRRDAWARVEVRDRGPGIAEEFRARMFQKFSQADSSDARARGGTGLGLNISKAIVERLGGTLGFESEVGHGSMFYLELPVHGEAHAAPSSCTSRPCVLVCEDDPEIARLVAMMLDKAGFGVDIASSAAQAREHAAEHTYAAMTVDLGLAGEDGVSLIRSLRQSPRTRELPIVVISAAESEGRIRLNSEALTVSDWLTKPVDENRLVVALRHAIERRATGRPRILHVEDDPDIQRIAAAIAQDFATFEFAGTLREARDLLARWHFDLVLLDLGLPDGSGCELIPELARRTPPVPVVVFTVDDANVAKDACVAAVLLKTATTNEQLLEAIRSALPGPHVGDVR